MQPSRSRLLSRLVLCAAAAAGLVAAISPAAAQSPEPTLQSGEFDGRLLIAADRESGMLSGYFNDGRCRFYFRDRLSVVPLYQRAELGEAYEALSWVPDRPDKRFSTEIYSRARGSFGEQITLEPGMDDDADRSTACRSRISLDRDAHVGIGYVGVRVIGKANARLFDVIVDGSSAQIRPRRDRAPQRDTGVWVEKTYGAAWAPAGYVRIAWYDPPGTPHGAYIRERDLYPIPAGTRDEPGDVAAEGRCSVLVDGSFEDLGDCASANPDGSFTIAPVARKGLRFDRRGLASIALRGLGYAYVRRDGHALLVPTFDNGPDAFADGLVRVRIGDKLGYADRRLSLAIPARYDGAMPFVQGRAWACVECELASDGEHGWYQGGQDLCLDQTGGERPATECTVAPPRPGQ